MEENKEKKVPDMENFTDAQKFVSELQKSTKSIKAAYKFAWIVAAAIAIFCVAFTFWKTKTESNLVYIISDESARLAKRADNTITKDQEIAIHLARFHEKFYNLSPNLETINENINAALSLADRSAVLMDNRRQEQRFYTNLVDNRIVEEIFIDSTWVNTSVYPYLAYTYGKLYIIRESTKVEYAYESSCELTNVPRSSSNPNGLMIQKFKEERRDLIR
jgi:conjugative transposon TraK protein